VKDVRATIGPRWATRLRHYDQRSAAIAAKTSEADDGGRTRDLRLGKPTLCQLSYVRAGLIVERKGGLSTVAQNVRGQRLGQQAVKLSHVRHHVPRIDYVVGAVED
jgi:hypothetical protein